MEYDPTAIEPDEETRPDRDGPPQEIDERGSDASLSDEAKARIGESSDGSA